MTTERCISSSNGTCSAGKSSKVWFCRMAIAVLTFSVCVVFWVMFSKIELTMDLVGDKLRCWTTRTSVYIVLNIVIVTIRLNSGPIILQQEMDSVCSSSIPVSEPYISEQPKPYCNISGEAMGEAGKKKKNTNSKSIMIPSATSLSNLPNLCCKQTSKAESATVSPCSTYRETGLVVFEICGVADEEEDYTYPEAKQEEEKTLVIRYREMEIGRDELYYKAESFINNFRRQLKMQRDDSWNSLAAAGL